MAIYRDKGRGTLVIDRIFRGIGRVKLATGCKDTRVGRTTAEGMEQMLVLFATDAGRREIVKAVKDRALDLQEVYPYYRRGDWDRIPRPEDLQRAFPVGVTPEERKRGAKAGAVGRWLPTYRTSKGTVSPAHLTRMRKCFVALEKLKPEARVADLPVMVRQYRELCEAAGTHREFQLAKYAVQTFLRSTQGRRQSRLWAEVADIPTLKPGEGKSTTRPGRTFTVDEARAIREALGPKHGAQWWAMCLTGMMPDEYFGRKFVEHGDRIEVRGTKRRHDDAARAGRRWREVPVLGPVTGPFTEYEAFLEACRALEERFGGDVKPYDARHTFAHWLERAGIDTSRRDVYRGHSAKTMRDLYERPDRVTHFLAEDRAALLALLGTEPEGRLRIVEGAVA